MTLQHTILLFVAQLYLASILLDLLTFLVCLPLPKRFKDAAEEVQPKVKDVAFLGLLGVTMTQAEMPGYLSALLTALMLVGLWAAIIFVVAFWTDSRSSKQAQIEEAR